jgi:hypothetical protein
MLILLDQFHYARIEPNSLPGDQEFENQRFAFG